MYKNQGVTSVKYEEFVKNVMDCNACDGNFEFICEPFRCISRINEVKVMFLGLSPGNPELETPKRNTAMCDVMTYIEKKIGAGYDTNYRHAMIDRIGKELPYVKANVVHGIGDKKAAVNVLATCGDKYLEEMISLFPALQYIIVYDFPDRKVLHYLEKFGIELDFENNDREDKGFRKNGLVFIAAKRTRRYVQRLPQRNERKRLKAL